MLKTVAAWHKSGQRFLLGSQLGRRVGWHGLNVKVVGLRHGTPFEDSGRATRILYRIVFMSQLSSQASRYQFGNTHWSMVLRAGEPQGSTAFHARNELMIRYHDAVYRYLVAKLGDSDAAGELFSRFAERVLEIHPFLRRADP